jgi:hypothetical protein
MPRHRSERGGADVVTPFSESRESKKVVSVTELLDQFKAETEPDAPQQPKWETVNGTGDSVLDNSPMSPHGATFLCRSAGPKRKSRTPTPSKRGNVQAAPIQYPRKSRKSRPAQSLSGQPTPAYHAGQTRNSTSQGLCAPALRQRPVGRV